MKSIRLWFLMLMMLLAPIMGYTACSVLSDFVIINEFNTKKNFVELYVVPDSIPIGSSFVIRVCSRNNNGSLACQNSNTLTYDGSTSYLVATMSILDNNAEMDFLVTDAVTGDVVDYLNAYMSSPVNFQTSSAADCGFDDPDAFPGKYIDRNNSGQREFYRIPDGGDGWMEEPQNSNNTSGGTNSGTTPTYTQLAEWQFDECRYDGTVGEVVDASGNGSHGTSKTAHGSGTIAQTNDAGKICRSVEFFGEGFNADPNNTWYEGDAYVEVNDSASLSPLDAVGQTMTITGWLYSNISGGTILHKGNGNNTQEYRVFLEGGHLKATIWNRDGSPTTVTIPQLVQVNTTYFFALSVSIINQTLNVTLTLSNGSSAYTANTVQQSFVYCQNTSGNLIFGATDWGSSVSGFFDGLIDEVKIYQDRLSAAEVAAIKASDDATVRACQPCGLELIADFHFDECYWEGISGEVLDASAGGHHLSLTGTGNTAAEDRVCRVAGFENAQLASSYDYEIDSGGVSYAFWLKMDTNNQAEWASNIFSTSDEIRHGMSMFMHNSSSRIRFAVGEYGTADYNITVADHVLQSDVWTHFVMTYKPGGMQRIYLNGVLHKEENSGVSLSAANIGDGMYFANVGSGAGPLNGLIDEFKMFNGELSEAEITDIYSNENSGNHWDGTVRSCDTCDATIHYSFDECTLGNTVSTVIDQSGAGNDGTGTFGGNGLTCVQGGCGKGVLFDGIDDYIRTDDDFSFTYEEGFSVLATLQFNWTTYRSWLLFFGMQDDGSDPCNNNGMHWLINVRDSGDCGRQGLGNTQFGVFCGPQNQFNLTAYEGQTVTLATVYDKDTMTLTTYLDGNPVDQSTASSHPSSGNAPVYIGKRWSSCSNDSYFKGIFEDIKIYNRKLTQAELIAVTCVPEIDHYEIQHDGHALTCQSETVKVVACKDSSFPCTNEHNNPTTAYLTATAGSWQTDPVNFTGNTDAVLQVTTPQTVTLGINNTGSSPASKNGYRCYNNSDGSEDCAIQFHDSGFIFESSGGGSSLSPQAACTSFNDIKLAAVQRDNVTNACVPTMTGPKNVDFWIDYDMPGTGTKLMSVNSISVGTTKTGVNVTFGADGRAPLTIAYPDAGKVTLNAEVTDSGFQYAGNTGSVVYVPDHFSLTNFSPANPATASSCSDDTCVSVNVFEKAGETFGFDVIAECANGTTTPNYQPYNVSNAVDAIAFSALMRGPDNGSDQTSNLGVTSAAGFVNGVSNINNQLFNEVGVMQMTVSQNFFGEAVVSGTAGVGRFIPDHFDVSLTNGSLLNACGSYTYLNQPFGFGGNYPVMTITAQNKSNGTTAYYEDTFWQLNLPLSTTYSDNTSASAPLNSTCLTQSLPNTSNVNGTVSFNLADGCSGTPFDYTRPNPSDDQIVSFTSALKLSVPVVDADGVCFEISGSCSNFVVNDISDTDIVSRHGKLDVMDNFGPETEPLVLQVVTRYWDDTRWVLNGLDSCTVLTTNDFDLTGGVAGSTSVDATNGVTLGEGSLRMGAPGVSGTVDVSLKPAPGVTYADWLSGGDNGTATFGIYRGRDRIISWEEIPGK